MGRPWGEEGGRQQLRQGCGRIGRGEAPERPFWGDTRVWTLPRGRGLEGGTSSGCRLEGIGCLGGLPTGQRSSAQAGDKPAGASPPY